MKDRYALGIKFEAGRLWVLDQTLLPHEEVWLESRNTRDMVGYIQRLAVRGAPLIGVAAALELGRQAWHGASPGEWDEAAKALRAARPTAVNLMAAVDCMMKFALCEPDLFMQRALEIFDEDVELCNAMADRGGEFVDDGDGILTHCNTGGLATAGVGTALGVIRRAHEQGKSVHVFVDETRPLLQGARLTAWELKKLKIPHTLLCDNMAASLMAAGKIQKIFVGADRIARNGDVANKIGTYSVAVLASFHRIPFYVVAPKTTLDLTCATGAQIPIEQREASEVRGRSAPQDAPVYNPAFDVTPRGLIKNIIFNDEVI